MARCRITCPSHKQVATNGIEMHRSHDMMRMDSIILSIQLTIRRMLTQQGLPEINIICERMSKAVHLTRYEDQVLLLHVDAMHVAPLQTSTHTCLQVRMPMGISINVATYSAKLLMQVAYNPQARSRCMHAHDNTAPCR